MEELIHPGGHDHIYLDPKPTLAMLPEAVTYLTPWLCMLTIYTSTQAMCACVVCCIE